MRQHVVIEDRQRSLFLAVAACCFVAMTLVACDGSDNSDGDTDTSAADGGSDAEDGGVVDENPAPPLAELSEGECPDLTTSGISTFRSAGHDRKVAVLFPDNPPRGLPVIFNFHGLTSPEYTPVEASQASLQAEANARDAIIVVPEARQQTLPFIGTFLLWGIMDDETPDLILFDDLRTCLSQTFEIDLKRISTWGHSGGALWNTALLMNRSDQLATVVEFSGGADFSIPFVGGPYLVYESPNSKVPVLLVTGGPEDVWPDSDSPMIEFEATTDTLQSHLAEDEHLVVRCRHTLGHYEIPTNGWDFSHEWMLTHRLGEPSPYAEDGLGAEDSWCASVESDDSQ